MKVLESIQKMYKQHLKIFLQEIKELESQSQELISSIDVLTTQDEHEKIQSCNIVLLADYLLASKKYKNQHKINLASIEVKIRKLEEQIFAEFNKLKQIEILMKNQTTRLDNMNNQCETNFLNEINTFKYINPNAA